MQQTFEFVRDTEGNWRADNLPPRALAPSFAQLCAPVLAQHFPETADASALQLTVSDTAVPDFRRGHWRAWTVTLPTGVAPVPPSCGIRLRELLNSTNDFWFQILVIE